MSIRGALSVAVIVCAACGRREERQSAAPPVAVASDAARSAARADLWRQDLTYLARELPARHVEPFFHRDEVAWRGDVATLDGQLAGATDDQIATRMAQVVASLGDGHTRLAVGAGPLYPLRLMWFDDGLFILATAEADAWAIGHRIVNIGGKPVDDALALLGSVAPFDNDSQRRSEAPSALLQPVFVRGLDLADSAGDVALLVDTGDKVRPLVLHAGTAKPVWPSQAGAPLARTKPGQAYWAQYLPDSRALFVQYNKCVDGVPTFAQFVATLASMIEQNPVDRIVVDLRNNGGGDSRVFAPFLALQRGHPELPVFVLTGRQTFSSAVLNALALEDAGAILVGEPPGGAPTHYGEVQTFALPNHPLQVVYSTKHHVHPRHPGAELTPAIRVPVTAADYFAGKDAALAAALAAPAP